MTIDCIVAYLINILGLVHPTTNTPIMDMLEKELLVEIDVIPHTTMSWYYLNGSGSINLFVLVDQ